MTQRIQAFEFCDSPQCPKWIRDTIVELLGRILRQGKIYDPAAPVFADFCQRAGVDTILDLGSGSGEPVSILLDALARQTLPVPSFVTSDLFPNVVAMREVARRHNGLIEVEESALDATHVPPRFDHCARSIISTFHHFPPPLASSILEDCVQKRQAVFILEPFPRELLRSFPIFVHALLPWLTHPFVTQQDRLLKTSLLLGAPGLFALLGTWDCLVSVLRQYTEDELRAMVAPFSDAYSWEYHQLPTSLGGAITVFMGFPL